MTPPISPLLLAPESFLFALLPRGPDMTQDSKWTHPLKTLCTGGNRRPSFQLTDSSYDSRLLADQSTLRAAGKRCVPVCACERVCAIKCQETDTKVSRVCFFFFLFLKYVLGITRAVEGVEGHVLIPRGLPPMGLLIMQR